MFKLKNSKINPDKVRLCQDLIKRSSGSMQEEGAGDQNQFKNTVKLTLNPSNFLDSEGIGGVEEECS